MISSLPKKTPSSNSPKLSVGSLPPQEVSTYSPHNLPQSQLPGRYPKTASHLGPSARRRDALAWPDSDRCGGSRPFAIVSTLSSGSRPSSLRTRSVNEVVSRGKAVATAVSWAIKICENSPDAVQATKHGLILGLLRGGVEEAFASHVWGEASKKVWAGENVKVGCIRNDMVLEYSPHLKEGLRAFVEVKI